MDWLTETLFSLGHNTPPVSREFIVQGEFIATDWYAILLDKARVYSTSIDVKNGLAPQFAEAPRPRKIDGFGWTVRQSIRDEMNNPADTFGLAEGDNDEYDSGQG
jgi:hypothetical protein